MLCITADSLHWPIGSAAGDATSVVDLPYIRNRSHMTDINEKSMPDLASEANQAKRPPLALAEPKDRAPDEAQSSPIGLIFIAGLFALLWFWGGPSYFWVVLGILVMIFLHELGHFMTARWTGMKATQFFLFMGPRLWSFQRGETEYGIRSIPAGAFVRIVGMHNLDPIEPGDESRAYMNKSYPRRMLVITAGSMMHFIQAVLLSLVAISLIGIPMVDNEDWTIAQIVPLGTGEEATPSPALEAGLEPGDTCLLYTSPSPRDRG